MEITPKFKIGDSVMIFSYPDLKCMIVDGHYSLLTNRMSYQVLIPAYGEFPPAEKYCIEEELEACSIENKKKKPGF
ncbi:MAG TPA: hypothetical protein VIK77_00305 [Tissierellaceae bacterium]